MATTVKMGGGGYSEEAEGLVGPKFVLGAERWVTIGTARVHAFEWVV